jgi:hypothetical protein
MGLAWVLVPKCFATRDAKEIAKLLVIQMSTDFLKYE